MRDSEELQRDVQNAIKWEPLLKAAEIGVTAKDGVVTLSGTVDSFFKKEEAEEAAKSVFGVKAVVEKIQVHFGNSIQKNDNDIATEIINAYRLNWEVPTDLVKVRVENGWVTLEGELEWNYQKDAAKRVVRYLDGVIGVSNNITIQSKSKDILEKSSIENALERNASLEDNDINVDVNGNKVTLKGTVSSWYQKDEAERVAWNAIGVANVNNELEVEYDFA
jgi:osmotically-inducible protein OsmY